ncbi:MAG: type II secretion system F family protein [Candidatus Schekmanbacteria bacterium]|nr:type II secretion system F family protein [Candidatus Schekmanbacteria bacterium]
MGKPLIDLLAGYNQSLSLRGYETKLGKKLSAAGQNTAPSEFLAIKQIGAIVGIIISLLLMKLHHSFNPPVLLSLTLMGFYLPNVWLNSTIKKRHVAIVKSLPYNLDLLTLSVEAGMDFTAAVGKVVETGQASPLIEELYRMLQEIKMGKTRREALRDMSKRIGLREVNSFTGALIQADQLGTSLGPILRMQSEQCSTEREQRAEKMAMEAPVKMLFPLILFIFPTIFIMIFVPIILKIIQIKGGN